MSSPKFTNALVNEKSLYLRQHAHNPVNWLPWSASIFESAKAQNKLVLVSIGYSSCHWCHVMEHESFENEHIAEIMNENFICVKVDREERPDVDQIYMDAVQLMTGRGGWPLNCIVLPNGNPIYGGTYFRIEDWQKVLLSVAQFYKENPEKAIEYGDKLKEGIFQSDWVHLGSSERFEDNFTQEGIEKWQASFDHKNGGTNRAPKFPLPNNYLFLLQYGYQENNRSILDHLALTLTKMGQGGIYDHLEGGFTRYSTDIQWKVPHFEKMLYDNGQLISLFAQAGAFYDNPNFKNKAYHCMQFAISRMKSTEELFYAAFDADTEGEEGKFYVWEENEIKSIVGNDWDWLSKYYHLTPSEKWEGNWVLHATDSFDTFCKKEGIGMELYKGKLENIHNKLIEKRNQRTYPGLDDKIICSWNALMVKGLIDVSRYLQNEEALMQAEAVFKSLKKHLWPNELQLYHNYKEKAYNEAYLDDYAFFIDTSIALYENTGSEIYLEDAKKLTLHCLDNFYNLEKGLFYYTSDKDKTLIVRKMELNDNVIPASNSQMAINLFRLGHYFANASWTKIAEQMYFSVQEQITSYMSGYSNWSILGLWIKHGIKELVIIGNDAKVWYSKIKSSYLPNYLIAYSLEASSLPLLKNRFQVDKTIGYICENGSCQEPIYDCEELKNICS